MNRFHGIFVKKICARIRKIRRISSINEATFFSEQTLSIAHNFWYHPFLFCLLYFLFSFFISLFDRNDIRWIAKQVNQFQGFFGGGDILKILLLNFLFSWKYSIPKFFREIDLCISFHEFFISLFYRNDIRWIAQLTTENPEFYGKDNWWKKNGIEFKLGMLFEWKRDNSLLQISSYCHQVKVEDCVILKQLNWMGM